MKTIKTLFIILVLSVTSILACGHRAYLFGRVTHKGQGVQGATVSAGRWAVRTNVSGFYWLLIPDCGAYTVRATSKRYQFQSEDIFLPVADANVFEIDFESKR